MGPYLIIPRKYPEMVLDKGGYYPLTFLMYMYIM